MAAIAGTAGVEPTLCGAIERGRHGRARQQGMSRLCRRLASCAGRRLPATRSCRWIASTTPYFRRSAPAPATDVETDYPDRVRRPVPHVVAGGNRGGDAGTGAQASELVDGAEGHHRFREPDEQRPRSDRGPSYFCIKPEGIDVLVHAQSVVHGLVAFRDGSVTAGSAPPTCASRSRIACPIRSG